jgi:hypothetical protein
MRVRAHSFHRRFLVSFFHFKIISCLKQYQNLLVMWNRNISVHNQFSVGFTSLISSNFTLTIWFFAPKIFLNILLSNLLTLIQAQKCYTCYLYKLNRTDVLRITVETIYFKFCFLLNISTLF